jgi:hypothetical protein
MLRQFFFRQQPVIELSSGISVPGFENLIGFFGNADFLHNNYAKCTMDPMM